MCCDYVFFKQKTAYEMRISGLSSDVCSSELRRYGPGRSGRAGGRRMAKRFGHNQRREMLALFKQLENDRLFGCAPAEPEDFVMSALPCELKPFSVTDEYERGRVERRVPCEMVLRAALKAGRAIEHAYVHSRLFNIDEGRYPLPNVTSHPAGLH